MTDDQPTPANDEATPDNDRDYVAELLSNLKQQKDELALKIHLGTMEAKEEFEKAQEKLGQVSEEFEPVKEAVAESAENIFSSLKLVAGEVKESFDRIRKSM